MPQDFQGRHRASYTRDTVQPTGPTYPAGITSCCAAQKLSPRKLPPHLLVSHYPEPTSEFPVPRAAPATPFSGYHHYKWWRKDNLKVKMGKRQSWNKGESSQIESLNNSFEKLLGCVWVCLWMGLCLCCTYKLSKWLDFFFVGDKGFLAHSVTWIKSIGHFSLKQQPTIKSNYSCWRNHDSRKQIFTFKHEQFFF